MDVATGTIGAFEIAGAEREVWLTVSVDAGAVA